MGWQMNVQLRQIAYAGSTEVKYDNHWESKNNFSLEETTHETRLDHLSSLGWTLNFYRILGSPSGGYEKLNVSYIV
jgi:hypothetical protein